MLQTASDFCAGPLPSAFAGWLRVRDTVTFHNPLPDVDEPQSIPSSFM
jgi:hypothetical protein